MSRIEKALEKANKLREAEITKMAELPNDKDVRLPEAINVNNPYLVSLTQPHSPVAEEYRKLKSMVIRATKADFLNTIMVSSAIDGEGKSLTALNLAISLAQEIDHSILLVDADLRKPLIHEYLGIKTKYGLSDYLTGNIDISEILVKTGIGNLSIMPAGNKTKNPVELLSSGKMKSLINELKHRYVDRYIILDTPPILPFAEAITLSSYVDGIIFVVKEGYAQRNIIKDAVNLFKDSNILGVVFNSVSSENLDGHYSKYYRGYYGKKEKK